MKYIYHHLGLGDHIICNGLVRHFKESQDKVFVFCKPHNFDNVNYMYRDDKGIEILPIGEDNDVNKFIIENNIYKDVIFVGFGELNKYINLFTFDESFYKIVNLPFDYRFSKFKFVRDEEKEKEVYKKLNPNNEKYIFVHGDLNRKKIRTDLKIIENSTEFKIFDLLKIIENAEEVHLMESSIKCLVNSIKFDKPSFFYHQYVRNYSESLNSKGINKFNTIF